MSSTQSFTLTLTKNNASTYLTGTASIGGNYVAVAGAFNTRYADLNNAAKNVLYPNATAHPIKLDASMRHSGYGVDRLRFSGTQIFSASDGDTESVSGRTDSVITQSNSSTEIRYVLDGSGAFGATRLADASLTLYFTRYDFSASAGTGIASATVSSATGYDGDTVTFTASVQNGYTWDGWYNGASKVSDSQTYVHTVNGSDLSLTAKAVASETKTVTVSYNGTTVAAETMPLPVAVIYSGTQIASVSSGQVKTLNCKDKVMSGDVTVGSRTLLCSGKRMTDYVVISVSSN